MQVTSEKELDAALQEWGGLVAQLSTIANEANGRIEVIKREAQDAAVTKVDGLLTVAIPERIEQLKAACVEYCTANKAVLIPDPTKIKSRKFTHGEIGFRKVPKSIADDAEAVEKRDGLLKRLITVVINALKRFKLLDGVKVKADRLYTIGVSVNRTAVLEAFEKGEITAEQLNELGLKVTGGHDGLWIKPATVTVTPHPGPQS